MRSLPVALLVAVGDHMVMPPLWVHSYGVGVTALVVPAVPTARSPAAWALFGVGLVVFAALSARAARTFLLTRRIGESSRSPGRWPRTSSTSSSATPSAAASF